MDRLTPYPLGELLQEESLQPLGVSQSCLAKAIGVPALRISEIVTGQRAITADTDLRLWRFLGLSPGYWLWAQAAHDTQLASAEPADELEQIQPLVAAQSLRSAPQSASSPRARSLGLATVTTTAVARCVRDGGGGGGVIVRQESRLTFLHGRFTHHPQPGALRREALYSGHADPRA